MRVVLCLHPFVSAAPKFKSHRRGSRLLKSAIRNPHSAIKRVAVLEWRAQTPQQSVRASRRRIQKDAKTERRSRRVRWHGRCDRRRSSVEKVLPRGDARCRRALRKRHRKTDHFPLKENQKTMKKLVLAGALV